MQVNFISATPRGQELIAYCARVSSKDQNNPRIKHLLQYCVNHGHWSVFEQAHMTIEIIASRSITRQVLRHKSFCFQEFSQRYQEVTQFEQIRARRQADNNRQSSIDNLPNEVKSWWAEILMKHQQASIELYNSALEKGIAREVARDLLPESAQSRLYMTGNIRSWIHYLDLRDKGDTQLEHRLIAEAIKPIFKEHFPIVASAVWPS
jgi:thymidylate synthase (FAD)